MKNKFLLIICCLFAIISDLYAQNPSNDCNISTQVLTVQNGTSCTTPVSGSTSGLTNSSYSSSAGGAGCALLGNEDDDGFYQFVATSTSTLISVDGASNFDAVLSVGPDCNDANKIVCRDNTGTDGIESALITTTIGSTYFIHIYDYASGSGNFTICLAQGPPNGSANCATPTKLCTDGGAVTFNAPVGGALPPGNNYGCLGTASSSGPSWFYIQMQNPGSVDILLTAGSDVDFALWGPYANLAAANAACGSLPAPIDCSFSASATENINIPGTATSGQIYLLMITNYAAIAQTFTVSQTGGTGTTDCANVLGACDISSIVLSSISACNDNGTVLTTDDYYSATVTVTFANKPTTGTLDLTGAGIYSGTYSVAVGSTTTATTQVFTNVLLKANATTGALTAAFSAKSTCNYSTTVAAVAPCSACSSPPSVAITQSNVTICKGGTATFNYTVANGPANVTTNGAGTLSALNLPNGTSTFTYTAALADAGTTVTVTATIPDPDGAGPCTASTDNVSVVVGNLSVTPTATPNAVCAGASSSLSATSAGGTAPVGYAWNNGGGSGTPVSVSPASTTTYTVTATDANACTATNTVSLTVNPLPTASISGTTAICSGGNTNISFTGTANATVTYTINGGANQTIVLSAAGTATVNTGALSSATTYALVSVTNGTCSQNVSGTAVISINALPTATIGGTTSICSGTSTNITFTGTANATVTYTVNGGANQVVALNAAGTATVNTGNLVANATYALVSVTNGTCSQNITGTAVVTVNVLPNATISGNATVCSGGNSNIVFTGTANATVTYTLNGVTQTVTLSAAGTATVNTGAISSTATYSLVSITNGTCSKSLTGSAVVSINALPTASISGATSICAGNNANVFFTGTPNATVSYVLNGTPQTIVLNASGTATVNTGAIAATAIYTLVSVTNGTCSQNVSGTVAITVNALPNATISGTTSICAGANTNITFSGTSGAIVTYNVNGGANQTVTLTGGTATVNTGALNANAIYDLVSVVSGSCSRNLTGSAIVTVNPLPNALISGTTSVCSGANALITFNGTSGAMVTYNVNGGANQTVTLTNGLATVNTGALASTATYNLVSITNGTCSQNLVGSATVTVNPTPTATYTLTGGGAYCAGGTGAVVGLSGSDLGVNYQLQVNGSNVGAVVAGTGAAISFGNQTTVGSYTVVATNATTNCTSSLSGGAVSISTNPLPTATINGSTTICSGSSANISFSGTSGATVTYNVNGGANQTVTLTNGLATVNTGALNANATYSLVSVNDGTCSQNLVGIATVTVNPTPTSTYNLTGGGAYCAGGTGAVVGLSGSDLGVNYQLQVNGSNVGAVVAGTGAAISFGNQTTVGSYTVVATNTTTNCTSSLSGGAVSISTNPLPTATINGSTTICSGSSANISFSGTIGAIVTYNVNGGANQTVTLTNGLATVNTGALNANATYTLLSVNDGTCSQNLVGSATVTVNPTPTNTYNLTGGGAYCAGGTGVAVGLSGSDLGVNYQLQVNGSNVGAAVAGTGAAISFGNQTTVGSYTVVATNTTTNCISSLSGGAVTVSTNPLPTATINGSTTICSGSSANISFSGTSGATVTYNVNGGANQTVTLTNGLATVNTGALNANATYTLVSVNDGTCSQNLVGSATVTVNPTPTATYTLTGGGAYCAGGMGAVVGLSGSDLGVNYQLQVNGSNVGAAVAGTGVAISFGNQTTIGSYTVVATNTTTNCISSLSGGAVSISTNPLPTATINGTTTVCAGGTANISFVGTIGATVTYNVNGGANQTVVLTNGLGTVNTGALNANTVYNLVSITDGTCSQNLTGSVTVTVNPTPTASFSLTGGGSYCVGGAGVLVGLSGSQVGINYQLQANGSNVGAVVAGTGAAISFGNQTTAGSYSVLAINTLTACSSTLSNGAVNVSVNPLPTSTVNGSTTICSGTSTSISFSGTIGAIVTYNINGGANQTATLTNGIAIVSTGVLNTNVTYNLVSITDGTCSQNLVGTATVNVNPLPTATFSLTGGGAYCAGGTGAVVGLSGSDLGVNYQLQVNGSNVGAVVAGTGAAISFGNQTAVGTYTVVATNTSTGCNAYLTSGAVAVSTNNLPIANINGSTTICSGANTTISFSGTSGAIVTYTVNGGANQTITLVNGLATINTGALTSITTYSLVSVSDGTCSQNLTGSAVVAINPLPIASIAIRGGGVYCAGGLGVVISLDTSEIGINYQLVLNGINTGAPVAGTGGLLSFGYQTGVGTYTIVATNPITGCSVALNGSTAIAMNPLPIAAISGTTAICAGDSANIILTGTPNATLIYSITTGGVSQNDTLIFPANGSVVLNTGALNANIDYTLVDVSDGICNQPLTDNATVTVNPTPNTTFTITGGGAYCAGGTGVILGLSGSELNVDYQLQINGQNVGTPFSGTGNPLTFGMQTAAGIYTISATNTLTTCASSNVGGSTTVSISPLPTASVVGTTTICAGTTTNITFSGTIGAIITYNVNGGANQTATLTNGSFILNVNPSTTTVYNLVSVALGSCTQNINTSATATVNTLPTASISGNTSICSGGNATISFTGTPNATVNYQVNGVAASLTLNAAGTATVNATALTATNVYSLVDVTLGSCSQAVSGTATVTVNPTPTASISGTTTICAGDNTNITFSGTIGAIITYNVNGGANQTATLINGSFILTVNPSTTTVYNLVSVALGSCPQNINTSATVTVNTLPTASISGNTSICSGGNATISFTGTPNAVVNYQVNGVAASLTLSAAGTATVNATALTATNVYTLVDATLGSCSQSVSGTATVTVNPTPTASISGTTTICAGGNTNLTFSGTIGAIITYNVNGGANQTATLINGSFILTVNPSTTTIYNLVSVTLGSCTQNINTSAIVTVNTLPTASISGNTSICSGGNATISFTGTPNAVVNYQVNGVAASLTLNAAGTATVNATALTATNVYALVDATLGSCSQAINGTATVTVNPTPTASISGTTTICAGTNTNLTFSGTIGAIITYNVNGGANQTATLTNGSFILTVNPSTTTVYNLVSVALGSCSQNINTSATVTVNTLPTASISGNTSICSGGNATISFTGTPNATVNYQVNGVAASLTLSAAGTATVNATALTSTNVYSLVDVTLGSCSQGISGTATVTVNPAPTASIVGTTTICSGDNTNITFSGTIGAIITYNVNGGANQTATLTNGSFILTVNPSTTMVYNLVSVALGSCTQNINTSATVTVNTLPTASISGTTSICSGGNATISFAGTPNATVNYQVNGVAASLTLSAAGTATVNATALTATNVYSLVDVTLGSCSQAVSGTATVTVNPTPTASISGTTAICAGTTTNITFSGTIGAIITYNVNGGANQTATLVNGSFILTVNPSTTTVYNLVSVALGSCTQNINTSATVTVNTLPTASISGNTSICSGGNATISFAGTPNATVNYQVNGVAASLTLNAAGTATVNATALTATNVYALVNVTLGSCSQALTGTATVMVNALPIASISGNTSICAGNSASINFAGTSGATVTYNVNGGANQTIVLTNGLAILNTGVLSANTTYNLLSVSLAGCAQVATGSATVNVNSSITVDAGTPQTLCQGGSVTLNGTMGGGATTAIWSAPSGAFTNATSLNATYSPSVSSGIVTLTLTVSDASGNCSASANVDITVNAGQDASFAYPAATYCQSSTLNPLPNIPTGNYTYTTLSPAGGISLNVTTGEIDLQNSLAGTYQIFNIVPSNGICPADTEYQFIIIEKTPDASFQYDKNIYCGSQYAPVLLQNTGQQGAFSYIGSTNLTLNVSTGAIDLTTSSYGTYLIINTVSGLGVCPVSTDTFELKYVEKPNAQITPSGTFDYCLVGNVNMQVSGGVTYQWLKNGQTIVGATNDTYTATQAGYYAAIAYNNEGCADTSEVVVINAGNAPDASVKTNGSTTFCEGSSVNLISVWLGDATYQWLRNGVLLNTNATQITVTDAANYQLVVSNACGADTSSIISTQIASTPIPNFTWSPEVIFKGQPVIFNDSSTNAATWSWYFGDGQIEYEENPTNVFYEAGEYTVYMQVRNSFGCDSSITKTLIVRNPGAYFIPNVFTPNGDGAFDTWQVEAEGYEKLEIEVFDRWGVQLFESSDAKKQWDGNTKGGRTCQNGVYFYHVKIYFFNGEVKEEKGNVTLIR